MNDKENTILSSILTATTGIAKTMKIMREEQKRQSERIDNIETTNEWLKDSAETTTKRLISLEENVANKLTELTDATHQGTSELSQQLGNASDTFKQSVDEKVSVLVDAITDETAIDDVKNLINVKSDDTMKALAGHHADVEQKFESMNQLKIMRSLIESLSTMQEDMTTLTHAITKNANDFASLAEANATMAARLGSVDVRLASLSVDKDDAGDADLDSLNEAVKLLEDLD